MKTPSSRQFLYYWLPPLLLTGGILIFSGDWGSSAHTKELVKWVLSWLPFPEQMEIDDTNGYLRKAGHVIVYGSLYWLWFRAFLGSSSRFGSAILWSLGFCLLIAVMDEGHQALLTSRQGRIMDIALDFGAAALVALALSLKRI